MSKNGKNKHWNFPKQQKLKLEKPEPEESLVFTD